MEKRSNAKTTEIFISADGYFAELVKKGMEFRKINADPNVEMYLVGLLNHYLDARNLFEEVEPESGHKAPKTLAELYMVAQNSQPAMRFELLKKLGDRSLYISGFFADSLERKLVDVDYYAEMGCVAYGSLAQSAQDSISHVYNTFSKRFLEFVDVLTYISHSSQIQSDQNILRLYDRYIKTGSELAREKLIENGIVALPRDQVKSTKQQ
jgi:hypothetical protein